MPLTIQTAKHLHDVYFGGNWTSSNLKNQLENVNWQQATTQVHTCNTIATLAYHIHYYVLAITDVLEGRPLTAKDSLSFTHPPINSEADWQQMQAKMWAEVTHLIQLIEQLPDSRFTENFAGEKYGNWYRNLHGLIEHTHYHLGQIALLKKIIAQTTTA